MKIFVIENTPGSQEPGFYIKNDSSLLIKNRPLFLPDMSSRFTVSFSPAIRINRLGKSIAPEFADRYYSQLALVANFTAIDLKSRLEDSGKSVDLSRHFDYSTAQSDFVELSEFTASTLKFSISGVEVEKFAMDQLEHSMNYTVSYLSRHIRLKIGDIISLRASTPEFEVKIGDVISGDLDSNRLLNFRIK